VAGLDPAIQAATAGRCLRTISAERHGRPYSLVVKIRHLAPDRISRRTAALNHLRHSQADHPMTGVGRERTGGIRATRSESGRSAGKTRKAKFELKPNFPAAHKLRHSRQGEAISAQSRLCEVASDGFGEGRSDG